MSKYANSKFVDKITEEETTSQAKLNSSANQALTDTNFNQVFASFTPTVSEISSLDGTTLAYADSKFQKNYRFGAIDMIPYNGRGISSDAAKVGCKTAPEYGTTSNVNMSRIDGNYHTFTTCKNKATMNNNKYFALVKPLSTSGITNSNFYECHVGNDPLISNADGKDNKGITSYYSYEICWSLGPSIKTFGLSSDTGDIIITGDNVSSIGAKQYSYSTSVETYTYGNKQTYLPSNTFVSLETFIFDLKQVSIQSGFINGGHVGKDIPISAISIVPDTNDTFIVGAKQNGSMKMVKIQLGIGNNKLYESLPNNNSLYVKAVEAKYYVPCRFVKITGPCYGDNYLQIAELQVFGPEENKNYALNKPTSSVNTYENNNATPSKGDSGEAKTEPYPFIFHSNSSCNAWWMVDLVEDVEITKIVYYNRKDCCQSRVNGAILECISSNGVVLYKFVMNGDDVQTFNIPKQNYSDLNKLWEKSNSEMLANSDSAKGHGIKGLTLRVDPVALGRGNDGYTTKQNTTLAPSANSYNTLNDVEPSVCQIACDNDPNCLGYTTYGDKLIPSNKEKAPTDLRCWKDSSTRAMPTSNGNGHNKESCQKKAQERGHKYFGLQYYGECWTTNDGPENNGYSRWNQDNDRQCGETGIDWQNHVYRREFENTIITNCNFYGDGISGSTNANPGSNVMVRTKTTFPVNNTTLNLTNNAIKLDLSQCTGNSCRFVLQLGNDGNITLTKVSSAGLTSSSTPTGQVVWNLFNYDPTVSEKIKNLPSITQQEWKNTASSDMLVAGETMPTNKKQLISGNGQFKLEINGGYLQLKTAVYGCFAKNYNYTSLPLYTEAVVNKPQYYYVYQTNLSHPKVGNIYYKTSGPNGTAAKQIERTNPILVPQNNYKTLNGYKPANDVSPNATSDNSMASCQNTCNSDPNCKYLYFTKDNRCYLGNQLQPAYVPDPAYYDSNSDNSPPDGKSNTTDPNYTLALRSLKLNVPDLQSSDNLKKEVEQPNVYHYKNFKPAYYGQTLADNGAVGYGATPIGKAFKSRFDTVFYQTGKQNASPPAAQDTVYTPTSYASPMPGPKQGFRNIEGFDSHGWSDPGAKCGSEPGKPGCFYGIKNGQINPLKQIAQDYGNKLNRINSMHRDLSNNINNYNSLRNEMVNDSNYDFSGDQKIVFSGNTDLLTEMKNDSKKIALQTNNLYIAGSILTTTLLVSAIYLGR